MPSFCCNATHFLKRTGRTHFVYSTSAWNTSSSPIVREQSYAKKKKKIKKNDKRYWHNIWNLRLFQINFTKAQVYALEETFEGNYHILSFNYFLH